MALPIIEVPKYMMTVPSTGERIAYRPYLVKEEKILMIAMESESQEQIMNAVKDIISACTYGKVNVDYLAIFDLEYMFLKLRAKSAGETSKIGLKCTQCETSNELEIPIDTIEVSGGGENSNTIMLTDKIGIKLKYPSVSDAEKLSAIKDGVTSIMKTIVTCIESIFDDEKVYPAKDSTPKELEAFIDSLNSDQFKKLQAFFENMPSLSYRTKFTCTNCGHENEVMIKGLANFFG